MADFSITAGNVVANAGQAKTKIAGEAIAAGEYIYVKNDGKAWKAQCDGTEAEADVIGMAVNSAAAGQVVAYQTGEVTVGSVYGAAAVPLVLSRTAGKAMPVDDLASGDRIVLLGWSKSATVSVVHVINTGIAVPGA